MMRDDLLLKEFLLDVGLLSRARIYTLEQDSERTGETFYQTLTSSGFLPEDDIRRAVSKSLSIPFVTPEPQDILNDTLFLLPEAFCRAHSLVAYKEEGKRLTILMLEPEAVEMVHTLHLPYTVIPHLTDRPTIKRTLLHYQRLLKEKHAGYIAQLSKAIVPATSNAIEDILYSAERLPMSQLVDMLFLHAWSQSATDMHLEPRVSGLLVRYRIGGHLYDALQLPLHIAPSIFARLKILAKLDPSSTSQQEGKFKVTLDTSAKSEQVTLLVVTMPIANQALCEKVVVRMSREKEGKSGFMLESLGFHGRGLESVHHMLNNKNGLLLVCGGSNSGTTTLLYSLLDHCIEPIKSVVTVEDPIEMKIPGAMQTSVDVEKGILTTFQIQSMLKMDPDILMVSRLDASDSAQAALRAANEGRFVLSSVRSPTALQGIAVLLESVPPNLVSSVLVGVVGIHLARRLCSEHTTSKLTRDELIELEARGAHLPKVLAVLKEEGCVDSATQWKDLLFGRAKPCPVCQDGYVGFVGIQEVLPTSRLLKEAIIQEAVSQMESPFSQNAQLSLLEDALYKAAIGMTSVEQVFELSL